MWRPGTATQRLRLQTWRDRDRAGSLSGADRAGGGSGLGWRAVRWPRVRADGQRLPVRRLELRRLPRFVRRRDARRGDAPRRALARRRWDRPVDRRGVLPDKRAWSSYGGLLRGRNEASIAPISVRRTSSAQAWRRSRGASASSAERSARGSRRLRASVTSCWGRILMFAHFKRRWPPSDGRTSPGSSVAWFRHGTLRMTAACSSS